VCGTMTGGPRRRWVLLAVVEHGAVTAREPRAADCPVDLRLPMLVSRWDCLREAVVRLVRVSWQFWEWNVFGAPW
jgi:hypothetical protein